MITHAAVNLAPIPSFAEQRPGQRAGDKRRRTNASGFALQLRNSRHAVWFGSPTLNYFD